MIQTLYAFQTATVLSDISSFLCSKLCYVFYFLNHLTQIALFFFFSEAVSQRCSIKKLFLEILQNSQENTCAMVSFLIKLAPATLLKKDSGKSAFLWSLRNFYKYVFYRTPLDDCFSKEACNSFECKIKQRRI